MKRKKGKEGRKLVTERELMVRVAAGDEESFARLYDAFADRLYRYVLFRTRRPELAEEAVQETMLTAWRSAGNFRGESALATWLFGICHHRLQHLRRKYREPPTPAGPEEPGVDPWPEKDEFLALRMALGAMDEKLREVVFLVYYQGMSLEETARVIGVPVGTVKSRLHTARSRLARMLGEGENGNG